MNLLPRFKLKFIITLATSIRTAELIVLAAYVHNFIRDNSVV